MQTIGALLDLKADSSGDEGVRGALGEMAGRVRSMALAQSLLYGSGSLSRIDLGAYLQELVGLIRSAATEAEGRVAIELEAEDTPVLIDTAVPIGLLVNELVTNALKHAFPGARKGVVRIRLEKRNGDGLRLGIEDDGIGLPGGTLPHRQGSFGWQIIEALATRQLGGTMEVSGDGGLRFSVAFKDGKRGEGG
jgi:two-component sensor histidine kinase